MTGAVWPSISLGEVARPISRPIAVLSGQTYRTIGVKWWGEGAYERETIDGSQTAAKSLSIVRQNDLIINKIWVRHGSTAIASAEVDGCAGSGEFPTFELNQALVLPRWMHWLTKTRAFWSKCDRLSQGTSGKNRIRPELFLTITIPLPPLDEQRRIVARIEELAAKIEEARGLRREATKAVESLFSQSLSALIDQGQHPTQQLGMILAENPRNGLSPQPEAETGGRPMLRISAVSSSPTRFVNMSDYKQVDVADSVAAPFTVLHDDVFVVRYNGDLDRLAKAGIYKGETTRTVYPDKLIRLRPSPQKMIPDFLVYALGSRLVRSQIAGLGKTTAGNIGISGGNVRSFVVSVPSLLEQRRIVAYLDGLQARVDALKRLQAETAAELDALLPSILDRAFKGELV